MPLNILAISIFTAIFCVQAIRKHQFHWLWFAVAVWLTVGGFSAYVLPNVMGITHQANLYLVHFYIFIGSIFFFVNDVKRLPTPDREGNPRVMTWHSPEVGGWLTLLAVSGVVMHAAFALLAFLLWLKYPEGYTPMFSTRLLFLYVFNPLNWYGLQLVIMALLALHRVMMREPIHVFSLAQIQMTFLICLTWFFLSILNVYQIIPLMIRHFLMRM